MPSIASFSRFLLRRLFARSPASTVVAVIAMALGVALTTTMFSVIDGYFLRGLPFADSHELVHLETNNLSRDIESMEVTQHDFEIWRQELASYEGLAGFTGGTFNLADGNRLPERFDGTWISPGFLALVGERPVVGRGFLPENEAPGAPQVLLLSHRVWQERYGGATDVVGRQVRVNSEPATIVGVAPEGFRFPIDADLWMPLQLETGAHQRGDDTIPTLEVFGRLRDGVTIDRAAAELATVTARLASEYPETNEGVGGVIKPYIDEFVGDEPRLVMGVMFVAVVLVLLIACFNVANLLIGRASLRSRELAIRTALGSGRWRVVGHVLAESAVVAFAGGVLGVGLAYFATGALDRAVQTMEPAFWVQMYVGPRSLLFALAATAAAALVAGVVPALQASRPDVSQVLQDQGRGSTSFRLGWVTRALVVLEVTFSAAVLIAAGLAIHSVVATHSYDLGFDSDHLLMARAGLFEADYPEEAQWAEFFGRLRDELAARPDVESVAIASVMPAETAIGAGRTRFERPGETYDHPFHMPLARHIVTSPGYFATLGVELLAGRDFTVADREGAPAVAIVNQDFAETEWGNENPIGKRVDLFLGEDEEAAEGGNAGWVEVVGVAPNLRFAEFDEEDDQQAIYLPLAQNPARFEWIVVRTRTEPLAFAEPLRRAVLELDPDLPLYFVRSMDQVLERTLFLPRLMGALFSTFGVVALILACVGLYGVMAFAVTQRTQEMGVRMALGAGRGDLLRMVLGQGMRQVAIGLVAGLALGWGLSKVLDGFFYGAGAGDPVTFVTVPLALVAVAALAILLPARRASRVDPLVALRYE